MAVHAENALRGARVTQVFNLSLAVPTSEAGSTECLVTGQDGQIFNLISTDGAAVGAVVADERAIAEEEKVGVGVKKRATRSAAKAIEMPSVSGYGGGQVSICS